MNYRVDGFINGLYLPYMNVVRIKLSYFTILILTAIFSESCAPQNTSVMKDQYVAITGIAHNGKAGALVKADHKVYYIDGLESWPSELINQKVMVSGKLKEEKVSTDSLINDQGEWRGGISGTILMILEAKWKVAGPDDN